MKIFEVYDLRARLFPAFLCLLPAIMLMVCVYGAGLPLWQTGLSLLMSCGFIFLLARISRDAGRRIQEKLFFAWSGSPTIQLLRHRNQHFDAHTKHELHTKLAALMCLPFPSRQDEEDGPQAADEVYRAAATWLIKRTRNTQRFPLLFKENIHFGFQRNALGLRWIGLGIALASIGWLVYHAGILEVHSPYYVPARWESMTVPMAASLLLSTAMALAWVFAVTKGATKRTAFVYAERLLESVDDLAVHAEAGR